jgi:hypothetical protein
MDLGEKSESKEGNEPGFRGRCICRSKVQETRSMGIR